MNSIVQSLPNSCSVNVLGYIRQVPKLLRGTMLAPIVICAFASIPSTGHAQVAASTNRSATAVSAITALRAVKLPTDVSKAGWIVLRKATIEDGVREDVLVSHPSGVIGLCVDEKAKKYQCAELVDADAGWDPIHFADFDGDGNADIAWQGPKGEVEVSRISKMAIVSHKAVTGATTDQLTHVIDIDGDGRADMIWRTAKGEISASLMNGPDVKAGGIKAIAAAGKEWTVVYAGLLDKVNALGRGTVVLRQPNGETAIWRMTGFTQIGGGNAKLTDDFIVRLIDGPVTTDQKVFEKVAPVCSIAATYSGTTNEIPFTGPQPYASPPGNWLFLRDNCNTVRWETVFEWSLNGVVQPPYTGNLWMPSLPSTAGAAVYYSARATHNGETSGPQFVSFRVDGWAPAAPTCTSITASPTSTTPGQNITLTMNGCTNAPDVREWRLGGNMIAVTTGATYVVPAPQTAGTYAFSATARNGTGASAAVTTNVMVTATNQQPQASFNSPTPNSIFFAPASVPASANVSDADGTIAKAEFFRAGYILGTKTAAPFDQVMSGLALGSNNLTVRATDNNGGMTTSSPILVYISNPLLNTSFEAPAITAGTVVWSAAITNWTGAGTYGLATTGYMTGSGRPATPLGSQAAVFAHSNGSLAQTSYLSPGRYTITFKALSENANGVVRLLQGGVQVGTANLATNVWTPVTFANLLVTTAGNITFTISSGSTAVAGNIYVDDLSQTAYVNLPPTVNVTAPANGATFASGATIGLTASASDLGGTINKVEYYSGAFLIGTATVAPYAVSWANVTGGNYTLTAKATDNELAVTTSAPINITVTGAANQPPAIGITAPANNTVYTSNSTTIAIAAAASDPDGSISRVEFFEGATKIATVTAAPYNFSWAGVTPGSYVLTAVAYDNVGATATSAPVNVLVNATNSVFLNSGFESPAVSGSPVFGTVIPNWITGTSEAIATGTWLTTFGNWPVPPEGVQAAYVQRVGGFLKQTLYLVAGTYTIRYKVMASSSMTNIQLTHNGVVISNPELTIIQWTEVVVPNVQVGTTGNQVFVFSGAPPVLGGALFFDDIRITQSSVITVPSISLATNGTTFPDPSTVTLTANVTDPSTVVSQVEFYQGSTKIATKTAAPFTHTTASLTSGSYTFTAKAIYFGQTSVSSNAIPVNVSAVPALGSTFVSQTVPTTMVAGQQYPITITMQNAGTSTWSTANSIRLGSQNPANNTTWNSGRVDVTGSVAQGQNATFSFNVTAPSTAGTYNFQWQMIQDPSNSFGAATPNVSVQVSSAPPVVQMVAPSSNIFAPLINLPLAATASSPAVGGSITKVEFFNGASLIQPAVTSATNGQYVLSWSSPGIGTYNISAKATDNFGTTTTSVAIQFVVAAASSLAASDNPAADTSNSVPDPNGVAVGATAGSFDVSESGSAGYSIPIALPPGTGGMMPSVGLSYSSQGGGGLVGAGWSLTGLSAVHRCPKNYYTDGIKGKISYDANDGYCLDGQRLIEITAGVYRTERDSFSRITPVANGWKVESKSGLIMFYGTDEAGLSVGIVAGHARIMAVDSTGAAINNAVKVWSLSKAVDRLGNYYLVEYEKDANLAQRPQRIRYTGTTTFAPYASVEFGYEDNLLEERAVLFDSAGSTSQQTKRLRAITTKIGSNFVRSYTLQYDTSNLTKRSLLRTLTECGFGEGVTDINSTSKLCLPASEFTLATPGATDSTLTQSQTPTAYPDMTGQGFTRVVDLNGDGKSDFIRYKGSNQWGVRLGGSNSEQTWNSPGGTDTRVVFGDFNGDGKTDFISEANSIWTQCISTGTGFSCSLLVPAGATNNIPQSPINPGEAFTLSGDFDGDGRIDVAFYMGRVNAKSLWRMCLSVGNGFNCSGDHIGPNESNQSAEFLGPNGKVVGDFNGDGRADIASYGKEGISTTNNWQVAFSTFVAGAAVQTGFALGPENTPAVYSWPKGTTVADMNGDGLADLISPDNTAPNGVGNWNVCLSRGDGTFDCSRWAGRPNDNFLYLAGDFNGDGRTDVAQHYATSFTGNGVAQLPGWWVCLSTGTSFNCSHWGNNVPANGDFLDFNANNLLGDFEGNGKTDIAILRTGGAGQEWAVVGATGQTPDMMVKAKDGLGKEANFTYKPLTDTSGATPIYIKGNAATFPALDIQSPMYVVSSMSTQDGIGATRSFSYTYKGLQGHSQGGGLLGFSERTVKDDLTNRTTTTTYQQDYANRLAGVPTQTVAKSSTGVILSTKTISWDKKTLQGLATPEKPGGLTIWQPYAIQSIDQAFEPNSPATPYITTTSSTLLANIDSYGNVSQSTVSTSDGFAKTTSTTFGDEDVANWLIGRPTIVSVLSTAPSTPSLTRASSFNYKFGTHLVETEVIEPNAADASLTITTAYEYNDGVGNRNKTTVTGLGLVGRTTTVIYGDPYKRFATSATNTLGHTATSLYDERFGAVKQSTDANNVFSTARYDRLGRKFASYSKLGVNQSTTYAGGAIAGAVMSITSVSSGAPTTTSHIDILGREIRRDSQSFDGSTVSVATSYDSRGRKTSVTRPYIGTPTTGTTFAYEGDDKLDRMLSDTAPDGGVTTFSYNGFSSSVTRNPGGGVLAQTTTRVTNSQGWTTSVVDAANNTTSYSYDALGNLTQVTKPGGGVVQMTYDLRSRKRTLVDPDAGTITYSYNAGGELLTEIVTGGRTSASTYDSLGRLATRTEIANGKTFTTTNTYDCANALGKLCSESITQPSGSNTRTYQRDVFSRVEQVTTSTTAYGRTKDFTSQSRFDSLSRAKLYSYPINGLTLTNEYNTLGYTTAVKELRGASTIIHWQANGRNADGQINSMNIGGALTNATTTKLYDSLGRVTNISTGSYQAASMDWDKVGNLTRRGDTAANAVNGTNEYFCHDQLNRVTHSSSSAISCASPPAASFGYSTLGNLTKAGVTTGYQANSNKLTTVNGAAVVYDIGGNITNDGSRTYTYTPFDIPDSITQTISAGSNPGIYQSEWGFGPDKQRTFELMRKAPIGSSTFAPIGMTWFAGAGHFELDEEIDANGNWVVNEFRHTISSPEGAIGVVAVAVNAGGSSITDRYFLKDHLGSNAGTFTVNGLESRATYDVWGNRISSGTPALSGFDTSQRGYTGHEHLATYGLIHMNGRIYDPLLGRFLQADPIIQSPYDLQSYNRYAYVMNNPLAYTDPTGYSRWNRIRDRVIKPIAIAVAAWYVGGLVSGMITDTASAGAYEFVSAQQAAAINTANAIAPAAGGAAGGFAAGGLAGGNLNSALSGAFTGGLSGGVNSLFANSSWLEKTAVRTLLGGGIARATGGRFSDGAKLAFALQVGQLLFDAAEDRTDRQKLLACSQRNTGDVCVRADGRLQTAGTRGLQNPDQYETDRAEFWDRHKVLDSVANRGMGPEGIRNPFINMVSKVHDAFNDWNYDRSTGQRIYGGGFETVGGRAMFEVGMNLYSFVGMPIAGLFVGAVAGSDYLPGIVSASKRR